MKKTIETLFRIYFIIIAFQALLFVAIAFRWIDFSISPQPISPAAERYILLLTIVGIPYTLWHYSQMLSKKDATSTLKTSLRLYKKANYFRLSILTTITLFNIVVYGISLKQNFMLCILMLFVTFAFCKPSIAFRGCLFAARARGSNAHAWGVANCGAQ